MSVPRQAAALSVTQSESYHLIWPFHIIRGIQTLSNQQRMIGRRFWRATTSSSRSINGVGKIRSSLRVVEEPYNAVTKWNQICQRQPSTLMDYTSEFALSLSRSLSKAHFVSMLKGYLSFLHALINWSLTGYLLYMSWSHLYIWGDNAQALRIAQSDSVSEAARNLRRNPIRLG